MYKEFCVNYTEHGIFEVKVENNTLLVDATGPFNEELIIKYEQALEACIKVLEGSPWNQVITLHQFSLFTPKAEKKLTQTLIHRKTRGLVACAVVLSDIKGEPLIKTQMSRCYNKAHVQHTYASSLEDAMQWFKALSNN